MLYYWRPDPIGPGLIQARTTAFLCCAGTAQEAVDFNKQAAGHDRLIADGWIEGSHSVRCVTEEFDVRWPGDPPSSVVVLPVVGWFVFLATAANVALWLFFR